MMPASRFTHTGAESGGSPEADLVNDTVDENVGVYKWLPNRLI